MTKLILIIALALTISTTFAGDCNNPLLAKFGFTGLSTPATIAGLKYCKTLQTTGVSCCDANTIATIQSRADAMSERLRVAVVARDQALVKVRDQVIPGISNNLVAVKANSDKAYTAVNTRVNPNAAAAAAALANMTNSMGSMTNSMNNVLGDLTSQLGNLQSATNAATSAASTAAATSAATAAAQQAANAATAQLAAAMGGLNANLGASNAASAAATSALNTALAGLNGLVPNATNTPMLALAQLRDNNTNNTAYQTPAAVLGVPSANATDAQLLAFTQNIQGVLTAAVSQKDQLKANFTAYQRARSTCVVEMVKIQAAAWCLACDPNYASQGVATDGTVTLGSTSCTELKNACYDFLTMSVAQTSILNVAGMTGVLDSLNSVMTGLATGGTASTVGSSLANISTTLSVPANDTAKPIVLPGGCTSASACDWICANYIVNGVVDEKVLGAGGSFSSSVASTTTTTSRLLVEEGSVVGRMLTQRKLQSSSWTPSNSEAGVSVTFASDPANVSAGRVTAGIFCVLAVVAGLIL